MATVRIPTPLRTLTGGEDQVQAAGDTVKDVIENLEKNHPGIRERLLDDKGVRRSKSSSPGTCSTSLRPGRSRARTFAAMRSNEE